MSKMGDCRNCGCSGIVHWIMEPFPCEGYCCPCEGFVQMDTEEDFWKEFES